jgi:hypothetical protein
LANITASLWTINGGSDYTVANTAITDVSWSISNNPTGFPAWINYAFNPDGFASFTSKSGRFRIDGKSVKLAFGCLGTSNATGFAVPLPVPNGSVGYDYPLRITDASVGTAWGMGEIVSSVGYMTVYVSAGGTAFSASGTKGVLNGYIEYLAAD